MNMLQPWIDALRSGKYTQVRGRTRTKDGFCAGAVLMDLNDANWIPSVYGTGYNTAGLFDGGGWTLGKIAERLGVPEKALLEAVLMNDLSGKSFSEIADALEAFKT